MPSQIDLLKAAIGRLEPVHGPDNPFVKGLKAQLIGLENQEYRATERLASKQSTTPEPEDLAAFKQYEKIISELNNSK